MKEYKFFLIDIEDHVALVTINNPKALNALSSPVVLEMIDVMQEISAMKDVQLVGEKITLRSRMHAADVPALEALADALLAG